MKKLLFFTVTALTLLSSCSTNPEGQMGDADLPPANSLDGAKLLQQKCNTCHNPDAPVGSRLAPPFFAIQKKYKMMHTSKEDFVAAIVDFSSDPQESKVQMKGAFEQFGLMPKQDFDKAELEAIASYIYLAEFHHPPSGDEVMTPIEQGKEYALNTKAILGKNLMGQINANGTDAALEFCNTKAIHFTDSMSIAQGVKIKRVSDKNRNPDNAANNSEMAYITSSKSILAEGGEPKPQLTETESGYVGYYPIMTNQMCLQCHGQKESQVKASTLALLAEKYPADLATGYGENELRGIWVVEWNK